MTQNSSKIITYQYRFTFDNAVEKTFSVHLNNTTLDLIPGTQNAPPDWTALTHHQCPDCPLNPAQYSRCPIAVNLVEMIDFFQEFPSFEQVTVQIDSDARVYTKHTSLQEGFSSLMGLYMATSGCPIMNKLKPMIRTHLPFATIPETFYRLLAAYVLAQYFLYRQGKEPDMDLSGLKALFKDIQHINKAFWRRLASISISDTSLNALVRLDSTAQYTAFSVDEDSLQEISLLFDAYF
ncbi:MAG TPA: hypothetical protein G4N96_13450 [Chloroflexi bacterium]|nr:hypothetical protein [Chloroflexota bacterium]